VCTSLGLTWSLFPLRLAAPGYLVGWACSLAVHRRSHSRQPDTHTVAFVGPRTAASQPPNQRGIPEVYRNVLTRRVLAGAAGAALAALALTGCGGSSNNNTPTGGSSSSAGSEYAGLSGSLKASGASFPNAFYQKALDEFSKVAPNLDITYNSVGS